MGAFLLACVALAAALLLWTQPEAATEAPGAATPSAATPATPETAAAPPVSEGPADLPAGPPLQVDVIPLEPNYTVEPGDTLNAIAARFGTTVEALRAFNHLEDDALLAIGQQLIVPEE